MFRGSDKQDVSRGAIESRDPFAAAPPNLSYYNIRPWGNPPEEVDVDIILENATAKIDEDEIFREEMFKLLLRVSLLNTW